MILLSASSKFSALILPQKELVRNSGFLCGKNLQILSVQEPAAHVLWLRKSVTKIGPPVSIV
jgi:hypothetical protein